MELNLFYMKQYIYSFQFNELISFLPGLPFQQRMKWWNQLPVYWKKEKEDKKQDGGDDEFGGNSAEENGGNSNEENAATNTEEAEELTDAEVEDLEVNRILTEIKDEL